MSGRFSFTIVILQTSYGIIHDSPPSLTQSESNSSHSPPQPVTPPQRTRPRYPDLGRVPLHRRGTSGTYERLEDLLREAGYKETRVFTPENERFNKPKAESSNRSSIADSVVGFLTSLIPSSSTLREPVSTTEDVLPAASPLVARHSRSPSISSIQSLGPTPKGKTSEHRRKLSLNNVPLPSSPLPQSPLPPTSPQPPQQPIFHPRPSRASAYLRNMASNPHLKRPRSALDHRETLYESEEDLFHSNRGNGEGEEEVPPPLPRTWLETVARAVLFGGAGAYIGGPTQPQSELTSPTTGTTPALMQARNVMAKSNEHARQHSQTSHASSSSSSSRRKWAANNRSNMSLYRSRSGLSDQTNRGRELALTSASTFASSTSAFSTSALSTRSVNPPPLLVRVGRTRSDKSIGQVSTTRVLCKSAPASRATSMSRRTSGTSNERDGGVGERRRASGKEKERRQAKRGRRAKLQRGYSAGDAEGVPTLARTRIEGDDLWDLNGPTMRVVTDPDRGTQYLRGTLSDSPDSSGSDDESSEDGELDLARMLVPPKRQNSIKSLRKHLAVDGTASASLLAITGRTTTPTPNPTPGYGSGNSRTFRQWMNNYKSPSDDWEDEIHGTSGGWGWPSGRRPQNARRGSHEDVDEASFLEFLQEDRKPGQRVGTSRSTTSNKIRTALPTSFVKETS